MKVCKDNVETKVTRLASNSHQNPSYCIAEFLQAFLSPLQNGRTPWVTLHFQCCKHKYLMFQSTQKMCLRRLLARCSAITLYNLFISLQPVFSPYNKGSHPRLAELILIKPCEALNQYSVYCLTYLLKNILY